jgi:hypothetical protein
MYLALAGLIGFIIAGILQLVGGNANVEIWLIIISGALVAAHCCALGRAWYTNR